MRALRDRRFLIAIGVLVIGGFVFQRQLGDLFREPAVPSSRVISCGDEVTGRNMPLNIAARECFWAAYQQRHPADFRTTRPTIEGDPITRTYRILAGGTIELTVDSREDKFSDRRIVVFDCPTLVRRDDPILPDPIDFETTDDCVEQLGP